MPWKKEKKMKYLKKLSNDINDDKNVAVELLLFWIGLMLTALVVFSILYYIQ